MSYGTHEYGGGPEPPNHEGPAGGTSVTDLRGPSEGEPDVRFELTARVAEIRLSSGRIVHALTYNGTSPGPELRVRQGDLVEVVLRNDDVTEGVTIHWHGVDVPSAEDGVAGVTQNAVQPGQTYTYRFRADQVGTFWYHTHQVSSREVRRGLFGVIVIEPRDRQPCFDIALAAHTFEGVPTLNGDEGGGRENGPSRHVRPHSARQHGQLRADVHRLGNTVPRPRHRRHRPARTGRATKRRDPSGSRRSGRPRLHAAGER
jgi:FtsP/CotA-like multicopper oxidase with cupredoxin domain